ncbi:MAG: hypothetical protein LBF15_03810 [Candidatus Peribacteria bacterium]|jgi:hypothetical protein|nr:hypothetical protein [Candidatus Peribacteria bacterium]
MSKLNDLRTDLQESIDLSPKKRIEVSKPIMKSTNDLSKANKKDLKLQKDKSIKISKNKTKKFDSFFEGKKKEEKVDIVNPKKNLNYFY